MICGCDHPGPGIRIGSSKGLREPHPTLPHVPLELEGGQGSALVFDVFEGILMPSSVSRSLSRSLPARSLTRSASWPGEATMSG